ncbi:MAG: hypothetical protein IJ747_01485 [Lachnospiraceae bacterium]|nr:hypothetical protein [Lachnospiraceae bacterium]
MENVFGVVDGAVQSVVQGRFTTQQVLIAVLAVVAAIVVIKAIKGILKTAVLVGGIIAFVIYFGLATPTQLKDMASETVEKAGQKYQAISQSIDVEDGEVYIIVGGKRLPLSDVVSFKKTLDGKIHILTSEGTYTSEDENLLKFFGEMSKSSE